MTTAREARSIGYEQGQDIVDANFDDLFRSFKSKNEGAFLVGQEHIFYTFCAAEAGEVEENARQFSPFEVTAKSLNDSRNPEAVWAAYEDGVNAGARSKASELLGQSAQKVWEIKP